MVLQSIRWAVEKVVVANFLPPETFCSLVSGKSVYYPNEERDVPVNKSMRDHDYETTDNIKQETQRFYQESQSEGEIKS